MKQFWIKLAQWGHLLFLAVWLYGMITPLLFASFRMLTFFLLVYSFVLLILLKLVIHAPRPFLLKHLQAPFWVPKHDSFPSGHAWLFGTGVMLLGIFRPGSLMFFSVVVIGILVSYARWRSGVHRLSEVIVGFFGGILCILLPILLL